MRTAVIFVGLVLMELVDVLAKSEGVDAGIGNGTMKLVTWFMAIAIIMDILEFVDRLGKQ